MLASIKKKGGILTHPHFMLRISWLFVSLGIPPKIRFDGQNGGNIQTKIWRRYKNISEIHPTLGFTEFGILEKYRKSFQKSELGSLHSAFPFESIAKETGLSQPCLGRRNCFSPSAKIALMELKAYTGFSDRLQVELLNGNIHYQLFCGIMIGSPCYIANYKIINFIRNGFALRFDIDSLQKILASHWKPYLENFHVCMTDATCYESHMHYPMGMKFLWESIEWLYRHICIHRGKFRHKTSP